MATMTLQIPTEQVGWFEQMVRTMGWVFTRNDSTTDATADDNRTITPALQHRINEARKEYAEGQTFTYRTPQEMQQFFDSL